jgi:hypothetical protein
LIRHIISNHCVSRDVATAILVAYACLLRVSEYTSRSQSSFVPTHTLKRSDVVIDPRFIRLQIPQSKTNKCNYDEFVYIYNAEGTFSAYGILLQYMLDTSHRAASLPLFMMDASASRPQIFVTRGIINACLKHQGTAVGMDVTCLSSHSLRIGGATALSDAGVPDRDIQFAGRWRSDTFLRYIRVSLRRLASIASALYVGPSSSIAPVASAYDHLDDILDLTPSATV